ncbi:cytochrome oxidase maturation protein, cbb3-type [Colwellia chukchiensis]|uniref:Cytochrome oxidase maturation protein, cbb3-type n=1 Tax=Colwellia chukchiensis TaxID=641665 RepID=A0A1H7U7F6_9GAMM|nr:cbb3-type cytochrome oxidase assembly protein CcoS [Colwellia chukchiensis]SEL92247.1 cytochrome oxidase maturation protein, cbb3-type [Colwellia chukchiensis]
MSIIYVLIPIAILLTAIGIYVFFWAVKTEQFEDLEKQGMSILFDDDKNLNQASAKNKDQHSNNQLVADKHTAQQNKDTGKLK